MCAARLWIFFCLVFVVVLRSSIQKTKVKENIIMLDGMKWKSFSSLAFYHNFKMYVDFFVWFSRRFQFNSTHTHMKNERKKQEKNKIFNFFFSFPPNKVVEKKRRFTRASADIHVYPMYPCKKKETKFCIDHIEWRYIVNLKCMQVGNIKKEEASFVLHGLKFKLEKNKCKNNVVLK